MSHTLVLWLPTFLALGDFKHHLWFRTHPPSPAHAYVQKLHRDYGEAAETTAAASSHKMSVGRHRWHRPRHNLPLIIYTVGFYCFNAET